jgi:hypothetical protein
MKKIYLALGLGAALVFVAYFFLKKKSSANNVSVVDSKTSLITTQVVDPHTLEVKEEVTVVTAQTVRAKYLGNIRPLKNGDELLAGALIEGYVGNDNLFHITIADLMTQKQLNGTDTIQLSEVELIA